MDERAAGIARKIVGFHLDQGQDWVAELECGHQQHVRHNPPWMSREWVMTAEGRAERIGHELICVACGAAEREDSTAGRRRKSSDGTPGAEVI